MKKEKCISELGLSDEMIEKFSSICKDNYSIISDTITVKDPITGEIQSITITSEQAKQMNSELEDTTVYERWINNQDFGKNGDKIKKVLIKMLSITQKVGDTILNIGKVVVDFFIKLIKKLLQEFPNTVLGMIGGLLLGLLVSCIPVLGWILDALVIPLFVSIGGILGFITDMKNKVNDPALVDNILNSVSSFTKSVANFSMESTKTAINAIKNLNNISSCF